MDCQHPRDLFGVLKMYESGGLSDAAVDWCVTYSAGHNRPPHEVLFGNEKDIAYEYHQHFVGMTTEPVSLDVVLEARARLREELPRRLTDQQKQF